MRSDATLWWELSAVPVIVLGGIVLHFVFQWSGRRRVVAVVAPVNESAWEHLKMVYWPTIAFTCIQLAADDKHPNVFAAKAAGFAVAATVLLGLNALTHKVAYRTVQAEVGSHLAVFASAVIAGQLLCYGVQRATTFGARAGGLILLAAPALVFAVATFRPPRNPLFRDEITGEYGIGSAIRH